MNKQIYRRREVGATALIIVMFFTLLLTVLSVGFIQLMVQERRASQDNELSQGAYDAALAGAEDGKRVLRACMNGDTRACTAINNNRCTTVSDAGLVVDSPSQGGTVVQSVSNGSSSSTNGADFSQAYTCVVINRNTRDVKGILAEDSSNIKALRPVAGKSFDRIVISWFMQEDASASKAYLTSGVTTPLTKRVSWNSNTPPIIRTQLMQYADGSLKMDDLDTTAGSSTVYLYPKYPGAATSLSFANDNRRSGTLTPSKIACSRDFLSNGGYACQATISLPTPVGGSANNRVAFLRLTALYGSANYSLQLKNGSEIVEFEGVQPAVDSTGRAADVYRRVVERVEVSDQAAIDSLYPRATVDTNSDFCKNFIVTADPADYTNNCPTLP